MITFSRSPETERFRRLQNYILSNKHTRLLLNQFRNKLGENRWDVEIVVHNEGIGKIKISPF